jgi:hypothetical protein
MSRFIYFNNSGNNQGDPSTALQYYNYLKGIWKDETVMEYGGNGHVSSGAFGPAARFMYPGTSDPCNWGTGGIPPYGPVDWSETNEGNEAGDRRGVCSMGPFTLEAGAYYNVDLAYVTAEDGDPQSSLDLMRTYIDDIKQVYFDDSDNFGFMPLALGENTLEDKKPVHVWPNPVNDILYFEAHASTEYKICNIFGQTVKTGLIQQNTNSISVSELQTGIYILLIKTDGYIQSGKFIKH